MLPLLGIWLFGALLRRELLSVAFHIFHFVDTDLLFRRWWKTARFEFLVMANLVPFIYSDVGAPASPIVFASDAQGSGELEGADCGGFGIVAAELPLPAVLSAWRAGFAPGKSITRLDGTTGTRWKAHKTAAPATPFSRLPREFWGRIGKCWLKGAGSGMTTSPWARAEPIFALHRPWRRVTTPTDCVSSGCRTTRRPRPA